MLALTRNESGTRPHIKPGEQFEIRLERPSGTGYRWTVEFNKDELSLIADTETSSSVRPGAPLMQEWIFATKARGLAQIRCLLARSWERSPTDTVEFNVDCR